MKYLITVIYLGSIMLLFNSCRKDNTINNATNATAIIGTWELEHAQISTNPIINYPLGNGNIIQFKDSLYAKYTNGNIVKSGYYVIIQDTSVVSEVGLIIPAGKFTNRIIFDNDLISKKTFIQILNNKLTFLSGFFPTDGGSDISYIRKENIR